MKSRLTQLLAMGAFALAVPALAQTYTVQDLGAAPRPRFRKRTRNSPKLLLSGR